MFYLVGFLALNFYMVDACARTQPADSTTVAPTTTTVLTTTTTTSPPCVSPSATSVGTTFGTNTISADTGVEQDPTDRCTVCTTGRREFFNGFSRTDQVSDAQADAMVSATIQCPAGQLCVCDAAGNCCSPVAGMDPPNVQIIPFCSGGTCSNKLILNGGGGQLTCDSGATINFNDQYDMDGFFLPLTSTVYFNVDEISCNGCAELRALSCHGPTVPV